MPQGVKKGCSPKSLFVTDLAAGEKVASPFYVTGQHASNGKAPHKLILRDRTGDIPAKLWPNAQAATWIEIAMAEYADVTGTVDYSPYSRGLEVNIATFKAIQQPSRLVDYLPACPGDRQAMWAEFGEMARSITQPTLRALLVRLAGDSAFRTSYCEAPAGEYNHHAYCGGLLEHSLEVARLAEAMARSLGLNRDLLVTAALMHDVGKVHELDYSTPSFARTAPGGFFGHVFLGAERLRGILRDLGLENDPVGDLVVHLLLSHHGKIEWGAPVTPSILEGFVLHACDQLSVQRFHLQKARKDESGRLFQYSKEMSGAVYTGPYPTSTEGNQPGAAANLVAERPSSNGQTSGGYLVNPSTNGVSTRERMRSPHIQALPPTGHEPPITHSIPLLGRIAAGIPVEEQSQVEDQVPLPQTGKVHEGDFLLRVSGDSMTGAHILDGDVLLVRPQRSAQRGDIVVALVDGESTVKYLAHRNGRPIWRPANPNYGDIVPTGELSIQGIVVGVLRGIV